ncbi:MAG: glycosyltransferase family 4 protein [Candidatus Woesearchaeota archaeon]|nr:glycosyltransferase family 4 protein [Candidatus Woesearchaeota archaeon]
MGQQIRVLMLNYEFPPLGGGAGNANYYMLKELSKKNAEIDLITSSEKKYKEERFSKNIRIYRLDVNKKDIHYWTAREIFDYTAKAIVLAKKLSKEKKYDLCHSFFALPTGIIAASLKVPYIISLRGSDVPGFNNRLNALKRIQKVFFRYICKKSSSVVANSAGLKKLAEESYDGKIDVIPNGIDTRQFSPGKKRKYLLCVSRLIPRKGIDHLISAMPQILKNHATSLIIIGEGPQKENLMQLANEKNVARKVRFLDYVKHDDLPKYYKDASIFILPSLHEGMSNTILEAMSCGLPIITTDTGGTNELIKDNGIIIKKGDSVEIACAADRILADKSKSDAMGKMSRKIASTMSWKNVSDDYFKLYNELTK